MEMKIGNQQYFVLGMKIKLDEYIYMVNRIYASYAELGYEAYVSKNRLL